MATQPRVSDKLRFDGYELDVRAGELRKQGVRLPLRGQPLQVLAILLQRAGDVVTREELRTRIWSADTFVDFDHSLHNAIARLREILGDSAEQPRYIETLPRRGYRFIERVYQIEHRASSAALSPSTEYASEVLQSLAVLPLDDLSAESGQEYFANGMTEALITTLARIGSMRVISRTSAMHYKNAHKPLQQIADELNVDAIVEGSVTRIGERVRITIQLIRAATDQHIWAESYERDFRDVLSLQNEVSRAIAREIAVKLTASERRQLGAERRVHPEAHDFYLKGRHYWNKRTDEAVRRALHLFQQALDRDPTFAPGYAGIADSYAILGYYNTIAPKEAYPKGRAAALKALQLDESLAEAHATLGVIKRDFEWDWPGAEEEFKAAITLNPGYAEAHHWRATLLCMLGRHQEGIAGKLKALEIDPLSVVISTDLGRMWYFARDYDRAIQQFHKALQMDPDFGSAHLWLGQALEHKGTFKEAIDALEAATRLLGRSRYALAKLGHCYATANQTRQARALLSELRSIPEGGYVSPYEIAIVHAALRENDDAFACLEKAFDARCLWLGYANVEPELDPLRSDPRFADLVRRVGLPS